MLANLFEEIEQLAIAAIPTTGTTIAASKPFHSCVELKLVHSVLETSPH